MPSKLNKAFGYPSLPKAMRHRYDSLPSGYLQDGEAVINVYVDTTAGPHRQCSVHTGQKRTHLHGSRGGPSGPGNQAWAELKKDAAPVPVRVRSLGAPVGLDCTGRDARAVYRPGLLDVKAARP